LGGSPLQFGRAMLGSPFNTEGVRAVTDGAPARRGAARRRALVAVCGAIFALAACVAVLLGVLTAVAEADNSWALPTYKAPDVPVAKYKLSDWRLGAGYSTSFLAANDNAQAVGFALKRGLSYPIYYSRGVVDDLQPILGYGLLDAIAPTGYAVGQGGGHPVFFHPGSPPISLDVNGTANGVALGPLVGVTTINSAGQPLAELWNPISGAVLPIGNARIGGIDAGGWVVGQADNGHAWYAAPGGGGTVSQYVLPFRGLLRGVNDYGWAFGYKLSQGGPFPILVDFTGASAMNYRTTDFHLTRGYRFGALLDVNDAGVAVGYEFKDLSAFRAGVGVPVLYPHGPDHPMLLGPLLHLPKYFRLNVFDSATDNGFLVGTGLSGSLTQAIMMVPHPYDKLAEVRSILFWGEAEGPSTEQLINKEIGEIQHDLDRRDETQACHDVAKLGSGLEDDADFLAAYDGEYSAETVDTYDDMVEVLEELYGEINCHQSLAFRLLDLNPLQSPFYLSVLAPGAGSVINTTTGPVSVTGSSP